MRRGWLLASRLELTHCSASSGLHSPRLPRNLVMRQPEVCGSALLKSTESPMRAALCLVAFLLFSARAFAAEPALPKPTGESIVSPDAKLELLFTRSAKIEGGLTEGP